MAPRNRIIFDTDVGGDDMIGILLAMTASAADIEVLLLSVVWGNVNVDKGLKNIMTMFHIAELEMQWRASRGDEIGFESLRTYKPVVAVGAPGALGEPEILKTDGFRWADKRLDGPDGVGNFHATHPNLTPSDEWRSLFDYTAPRPGHTPTYFNYFTPSRLPAHKEMLRILRNEPAGTVTVCSVGPMTNIALAAAEDPEAFLRMKELLVMGGAIDVPGNINPVAEANTWNDAVACARVFALTSLDPSSTMPVQQGPEIPLGPYPEGLSKRLCLKLFPLDITLNHYVDYARFVEAVKPQMEMGSPLAVFVDTFLGAIFQKVQFQYGDNASAKLALHDGLTVWYALSSHDPGWGLALNAPEDIRIEAAGQWTHGMHVPDRRNKRHADGVNETEIPGDSLGWLSSIRGNRINVVATSPGGEVYHSRILQQIFRVA
ncbi:Inosine/uridine-preferring nucleoside hydrolase domain-containing protein [Aspergillus karnatakaensis]|uniref:Inosine/uridine-preferring nucleoside hydrolase domain-containing protein n=1 Tax=Aspergillus karnatakaensis TaxID=1810916 RepID=UPI003CCE277E